MTPRVSDEQDAVFERLNLLSDSPERVRKAHELLEPSTLSGGVLEVWDAHTSKGGALCIGPVLGRGESHPATETEPLLKLLFSTEEEAVAELLRADGIRLVAADRRLARVLDRDGSVISRLTRHDHLEWFELRYVTGDAFLYTVRATPARIRTETGTELLQALRDRLGRSTSPRSPKWTPNAVQLIGSLRLQGRTLVRAFARDTHLPTALDLLAGRLRTEWRSAAEVLGLGRLTARLSDVKIEVHVVLERAPVEPRDRHSLEELWEVGVDGVVFRHREEAEVQKLTVIPGCEATNLSHRSADEFLRWAVKEGRWRDLRPWEDRSTRLDLMRTNHWIESRPGGGKGLPLTRGLPSRLEVDRIRLLNMLKAGAEWWLKNMRDDGSVNYKFWPVTNRFSTEYNEVRHILAARDLAAAHRHLDDERYLEGARRAMDWLMAFLIDGDSPKKQTPPDGLLPLPDPPPGALLFRYPSEKKSSGPRPNQKLGTVAVALLGWIEWARASGSASEDDRIVRMARYVDSRVREDGSFHAYDVPADHPYAEISNDIVPGEAALALTEVAAYFEDSSWLSFFPGFLDHYEPWFEERVRRRHPHGRRPHGLYDNDDRLELVQFGPWAAMACSRYARLVDDPRAAEFGLRIADWMIDAYLWSKEQAPFPDYAGGYFKRVTELPAMQSFCYSEGTAAAYDLALHVAPQRAERFRQATLESLELLTVMQYDERNSYCFSRPEVIRGGIRYSLNESKVRIDYVGHALSTITQFLDASSRQHAR